MYNILTTYVKPNRLIPEKDKDDNYHIDMANWCASNGMNQKYTEHCNRIQINKNFFLPNKQWCLEEDLVAFLKDDGGNDRHRLRVEMNHIQSMVNQFVGNGVRMNITARARSISPLVKSRRDEALSKMLYFTDVANDTMDSKLTEKLRNEMPIGKTQAETELIFNNIYNDKYVKSINSLLANVEVKNDFNGKKARCAEMLSLAGICIMKPYIHSGEQRFMLIQPEDFIFDRSSKEYDLSDAGYMGEFYRMLPTEIYERFTSLTTAECKLIEKYSKNYGGNLYGTRVDTEGRIPVFTMYWRDVVSDEWGYVYDEFQQIIFARVNFIGEFDKVAKYTDKDLVPLNKLTPYQLKQIKKNDKSKGLSKMVTYTDQWRYCSFIPPEVMGTVDSSKHGIYLEGGIMPFQEKDLYSSFNMATPYKVNMYIYIDGDIFSPVDIAINPQRMINRFLSVFENQVNNSGGSGLMYDPDMVENEADFLRAVNDSKPVPIRTKGMPIQNVLSSYDNTIGRGTVQMLEFINVFKNGLETITGVNEAMKGQSMGSEQLVGVTQLMIQKGSVIQQRFYSAIETLFKQCYQCIATVGKRLYIENETTLVDMVGEDDYSVIVLSKDMKLEDFRVEIATSLDPETERKAVDTRILQYVQMGFLDQRRASNLLERATSIDLSIAIREYAKEKAEIERQQAEAAQQNQQKIQQESLTQQMINEDRQNNIINADLQDREKNRQTELMKTAMKTAGNNNEVKVEE